MRYAVYSVTLWARGKKLEFISHLFQGMLVCAATISCTSLRLDMNISPIVDKERGTERRLAGQVLSGDRERSRISIESQATLEWGQPKCHLLDLGSEKQKQKTSLAHCSLVDRNAKLFTC